ncbi:LOW QUALITY PROTEIN: Las1-like, partial [Trema orientale]
HFTYLEGTPSSSSWLSSSISHYAGRTLTSHSQPHSERRVLEASLETTLQRGPTLIQRRRRSTDTERTKYSFIPETYIYIYIYITFFLGCCVMESVLAFEEEQREFQQQQILSSPSPSSYGLKLVPWMTWDEWLFVYDSLFSDSLSLDAVASALRRISTWGSRGCLPVTIEVTASIIEIQMRDPHFRKDKAIDASGENRENQGSDVSLSDEMLAMLYCMAIMRLVNGVVEKTRKKHEVSIAVAADAIGMPRTLIDIRHEGSHRELPALQIVRRASVKALDWLKSYYWEPQKKAIPFQGDSTIKIRKRIKSKLHELAFCLKAKESPQPSSSPLQGKRRQPLISSDYSPEVHQVEHLSSIFTWLVRNLKELKRRHLKDSTADRKSSTGDANLKRCCHKDSTAEIKSCTGDSTVSKVVLMQLIRKCLRLSASGNQQLIDSAFHIAQLIGDDHLMKKLNKLSFLVSSNSEIISDGSSLIDSKDLLIQQEEFISQASKKLESIKHQRMMSKVPKTTDGDVGISRRWVVATSWNPCPIGMLPNSVGSSGCLPVLDWKHDQNKIPEMSQERENLVSNQYSETIEPTPTSDIPLLDDFADNKRRRTVEEEEDCISDGDNVRSPEDLDAQLLLIDGVWKKFGGGDEVWDKCEELLAIKRQCCKDNCLGKNTKVTHV